MTGNKPTLVIADPHMAHELLVTNGKVTSNRFHNNDRHDFQSNNTPYVLLYYNFTFIILLGNSVIVLFILHQTILICINFIHRGLILSPPDKFWNTLRKTGNKLISYNMKRERTGGGRLYYHL